MLFWECAWVRAHQNKSSLVLLRLTRTVSRSNDSRSPEGSITSACGLSETAQAFNSGCLLAGSKIGLVTQFGLPSSQWIGIKSAPRTMSGLSRTGVTQLPRRDESLTRSP